MDLNDKNGKDNINIENLHIYNNNNGSTNTNISPIVYVFGFVVALIIGAMAVGALPVPEGIALSIALGAISMTIGIDF